MNGELKEACVLLGQVLVDQGRDADAEECYRDAVALDEGYLLAHFSLGSKMAVSICRAVDLAKPESIAIAVLQNRLGKVDESIAHFDTCLALDPSHNDARRALTAGLARLGRPRDASECSNARLWIDSDGRMVGLGRDYRRL